MRTAPGQAMHTRILQIGARDSRRSVSQECPVCLSRTTLYGGRVAVENDRAVVPPGNLLLASMVAPPLSWYSRTVLGAEEHECSGRAGPQRHPSPLTVAFVLRQSSRMFTNRNAKHDSRIPVSRSNGS
ncbi:hypothetical protein MRX96_029267 [Rhipicephalus microplus]